MPLGDLTEKVHNVVKKSGIKNGLIHVFAPHATGVLILTEHEPSLDSDVKDFLEKIIPKHGGSDIRAFVIGDRVVASMSRVSENWKTNVSLGAKPVSLNLPEELANLAVKAAKVIGCKVTGVDLIEGPKGPVLIELNSQPGWRGLQSVTKIIIADEIINYIKSELKA